MPDGNRLEVAPLQRAYSLLTIKSVNEEERVITGTASTINADRMGDIVEPKGAQFALPLPLLYQHNSRQPIGHVTAAKVSTDSIEITARIAKGVPVPFIDEAWALIKAGLVQGLSIGFSPVEYNFMKDGGVHFEKWDWYELSVVTIPANADASIQTIKSIDASLRAASGAQQPVVVRLSTPPGASGKPQLPKVPQMKTPLAQQIAALEAKRVASASRRDEVQQKALDEGRTKDAAEKEEFTTLSGEIDAIDAELVDLRLMEKQARLSAAPAADPADPTKRPANPVQVERQPYIDVQLPKLDKGIKFARWCIAMAAAKGNLSEAKAFVENRKDWADSSPEVMKMATLAVKLGSADFASHMLSKTAIPAGDTTTSGWASELAYAQNVESEFVEYLRPKTVIGKINALVPFRRVPFNFRTGTMTGGTTAFWVGQGQPTPMSKPTTGSGTMGIAKLAGMTAVDDELLRLSSPSVEMMVRDDLARAISYLADVSFLDPNQGGVANVQPASITYGVTANQASGTDYAAIKTDVKAAFSGMISANQGIAGGVWVMSETTALALTLMQNSLGQPVFPGMQEAGGSWLGRPVVVSQAANITGSPDYGNMIVLVYPNEVWLADDGQASVEISREASIQMLDNPTNLSTGGTVATTMVSMFQTNSAAIKAVRYINWKVRGARTPVGLIRTTAYA